MIPKFIMTSKLKFTHNLKIPHINLRCSDLNLNGSIQSPDLGSYFLPVLSTISEPTSTFRIPSDNFHLISLTQIILPQLSF